MFNSGLESKLENLEKSNKLNHWFYDTLMFKKTKKALGGRTRLMITGSAPISA